MNQGGGMNVYGLNIPPGVPIIGVDGIVDKEGPGVVGGRSEWNTAKRSPFGGV